MRLCLFVFAVYFVFCFACKPAVAATPNCPPIDHFVQFQDSFFGQWKVSPIVSAFFTPETSITGPSTFSYAFSGLDPNFPSTGGVPGLMAYCIYSSESESSITVSGGLTTGLTQGFGVFGFLRTGSDAGNIPFDGKVHTLGSSLFNIGFPAVQSILLEINDTAECKRLYGSTPDGTCFVLPSGTPQPVLTLGQKAANNAIGLLQMPHYFLGAKGYDYAKDLYATATAISVGYEHCDGSTGCTGFSTKPGIDCSGLILWSYNTAFGATSNYANPPNPIRYEGASGQCSDPQSQLLTVSDPVTQLEPGDLLCFDYHEASGVLSGHVAMYTGGGNVAEAYIGKGVVQSSVNPDASGNTRATFDRIANWSQCSSPTSTRCFDFLGYRRPNSAQVGIAFNTHSPVTLNVTDPDGYSINAETSVPSEREIRREIPGQFYYLENANGDDTVIAPQLKRGRYFVQVFPKAQALATDTYSLTVDATNGTAVLAQNTPIAQIPARGYGIDTSSGQMQPFIPVSIDIKPGGIPNSINLHSEGTIPVAILSTPDFDAAGRVKATTLTFGHSGDEVSLAFCNSEDINGDGLEDLVCHFSTRLSGFVMSDTQGILKGQTKDAVPIFGTDFVRIIH